MQIDELRMESEMPLEELLAKYRSVSASCGVLGAVSCDVCG